MGIWQKKSIEDLQNSPDVKNPKFKRTLSAFDLILMGIGVIVGAGLFSVTGVAAAENAGPAIVISFIFAACGCAFAGLCYSELATMIPLSGSTYTYTYAAMGELPAWIIGWSLVLEYIIGAATVSISWSAYALSFLQDFDISFPTALSGSAWQPMTLSDGTTVTGFINLPALAIVICISLLLIRGSRQSALINTLIVITKIAVVILFIIFGYAFIDPSNYTPFIPENTGTFGEFGWSGILRATGIVFFAYIGFDALSTMSLEVKNPAKTPPIGILGSLFICTILYILFALVLTGLANYKELDVAAPVAVAIAKMPYPWLNWLIKLAVLAGLTSVILVLLFAQSRIFYAMTCDGFLPSIFAKLHPTYHTPWYSNLILMVLVGPIAAFGSIELMSHLTSIGTLLAFTIVCCGVIILRYTHPETPRPFKAPFFPIVPILGVLTCLSMMLCLGVLSWIRLIGWMIIGVLIYFTYSRHRIAKLQNNQSLNDVSNQKKS
ncbi:MAG: amino acid permease [Parachlamydiaceae bacterium]